MLTEVVRALTEVRGAQSGTVSTGGVGITWVLGPRQEARGLGTACSGWELEALREDKG